MEAWFLFHNFASTIQKCMVIRSFLGLGLIVNFGLINIMNIIFKIKPARTHYWIYNIRHMI